MLVYLFTQYPVHSETFLQREQFVFNFLKKRRIILSLYHGYFFWQLNYIYKLKLLLFKYTLNFKTILFFLLKKDLWNSITKNYFTSFENICENLLGFITGPLYSSYLRKYCLWTSHGVWASMPSTCALFLKYQIKLNYSIGAHAFDIFQNNGDLLLNIKAINCNFIHTSTLNGVYRLRKKLFLFNKKIKLIRRGLVSISFKLPQRKVSSKKIINIFSVGRLVFKKDYKFQLFLLHSLMKNNIKAKLTICGNGLLLKKLLYYIANLNLNLYIKIFYNLNFRSLKKLYKKFDVFIFTGKTLLDGDKDGLPNVIAEAMSFGVPVISFNIGGVPEVIKPNKNGFVMSIKNLFLFVEKLVSNFKCNKKHRKICIMSQIWIIKKFNSYRNTLDLNFNFLKYN